MGTTGNRGDRPEDYYADGLSSNQSANGYEGRFGIGSGKENTIPFGTGNPQLSSKLSNGAAQGLNQQGSGNTASSNPYCETLSTGLNIWSINYKNQLDKPFYDIQCCTINLVVKKDGRLVMGAGTARDFAMKYRNIDHVFGGIIRRRQNKRQIVVAKDDAVWGSEWLVGIPTKNNWQDPSNIDLVYESMFYLVQFADMVGANTVLLPAPGCGHGGLDWETVVKPELMRIPGLDGRFHVCIKK